MTQTFKVWFQTVPPRPSWTAYKHRSVGLLTVLADHALFQPKSGAPVVVERVFRVSKGWKESIYGKPLIRRVDTYIEVLYGDPDSPGVAFVNDGRWLGLATYLPHRKLVSALESLISPPDSN